MSTVASPIDSVLRPSDRTVLKRWAVAVALWGTAIGALSLTGGLSWMSPLALGPLVAVGMAAPVAVVRRSPHQRRLVREVDLAHLTWFNVGAQGLLPAPFVTNAACGDLIAGGLAPVVVLAARHVAARRRTGAYLAFHLFSFGDFLVAVGTGLTFTVLGDPLMRTLLDTRWR